MARKQLDSKGNEVASGTANSFVADDTDPNGVIFDGTTGTDPISSLLRMLTGTTQKLTPESGRESDNFRVMGKDNIQTGINEEPRSEQNEPLAKDIPMNLTGEQEASNSIADYQKSYNAANPNATPLAVDGIMGPLTKATIDASVGSAPNDVMVDQAMGAFPNDDAGTPSQTNVNTPDAVSPAPASQKSPSNNDAMLAARQAQLKGKFNTVGAYPNDVIPDTRSGMAKGADAIGGVVDTGLDAIRDAYGNAMQIGTDFLFPDDASGNRDALKSGIEDKRVSSIDASSGDIGTSAIDPMMSNVLAPKVTPSSGMIDLPPPPVPPSNIGSEDIINTKYYPPLPKDPSRGGPQEMDLTGDVAGLYGTKTNLNPKGGIPQENNPATMSTDLGNRIPMPLAQEFVASPGMAQEFDPLKPVQPSVQTLLNRLQAQMNTNTSP
jgi:hypothetical protein